jgi:His-Xaa-Ser system protein HxsD
MEYPDSTATPDALHAVVEVDLTFIDTDTLLKACYWLSKDYTCEIRNKSDRLADVVLTPRSTVSAENLLLAKNAFITSAMDFALREKIEAKTSDIRDLLLAKAFSESGVLEDKPEGVFGDDVEESKPDGMFKILSNPNVDRK